MAKDAELVFGASSESVTQIKLDLLGIVDKVEKSGATKLRFTVDESGVKTLQANTNSAMSSASNSVSKYSKQLVQYYKDLDKQNTSFNAKNLNGIDYEIKQREIAAKQFSAQLQSQMQHEQAEANLAESNAKKTSSAIKSQTNAHLQYNNILGQAKDYYDKYSTSIQKNAQLNAKWQEYLNNMQSSETATSSYGSQTGARSAMSDLTRQTREAGAQVETLRDKLGRLFGIHVSTMLTMLGIHALMQSLSQVYQSVVEVDTAMTELKKVTDETNEVYANFLDNASSRAQKLGATISDVVQATADFSRLGYGLSDASTLADAALVYKNVGDGIDNVTVASESLISTIKAFGIEASKSMSIVDEYNEVGNHFAISSNDIGVALKTASSALASANNTMEESIGLAVGMNATVQDAEKVGTTLKTMSMYLRAAKTEADAAGESTEGMANSVSELREELLTLTNNKVDIMLDDSTFKSTFEISKELSEVWSSLSDIDTANILELIGGKRNASAVSSLLTNFKDAQAAMETASNSAGSALSENEKYLDSIQGKLSQVQATFQSVSNNVLNSNLVKTALDIANAILKGTDGLAKANLLFPAIFASVLAIKSAAKLNDSFLMKVAAVA